MGILAAHHSVCALWGGAPDAAAGLAADRIVLGSLGTGLHHALDAGAEWIWVLDGTAMPTPAALPALLDAIDRASALPEPASRFGTPVLFASVVVDECGAVDEARGGWYRRNHIDLTMGSSGSRLLPIRAAGGPVLVHRDAAENAPACEGVFEWTAHILRDGVGFLVPESESVALAPADDPLGDPRTFARLVRSGALGRLDIARAMHELVERFRPPAPGSRPARR